MPVLIHGRTNGPLRRTNEHRNEQHHQLCDESDDDSSCLSKPEWRAYWEKPQYSSLGYFQHRERLLRRILRDNPLADQIRRRERAVRLLQYQHQKPQRVKAKHHMVLTELLVKSEEKASVWKDFWIFEWYSFIPAAYCLLIHCLAHSAIDDLVQMVFGGGLLAAVVGILLLRLSGDLYWWLDDDTYDALRVDFGNRRRLGRDMELEVGRNIRRRPIVRAICFMIGYPICYMVSASFNDSIEKALFDEFDNVATNLPSALYESPNGTCLAPVSFCSATCQDVLKARGRWRHTILMQTHLALFRDDHGHPSSSGSHLYLEVASGGWI